MPLKHDTVTIILLGRYVRFALRGLLCSYQAETHMMINRTYVQQVQPGLVAPVKFANDTTRVAIDYS